MEVIFTRKSLNKKGQPVTKTYDWTKMSLYQKRQFMLTNKGPIGCRDFTYTSHENYALIKAYKGSYYSPVEDACYVSEKEFKSARAFFKHLDQCIAEVDKGNGIPW